MSDKDNGKTNQEGNGQTTSFQLPSGRAMTITLDRAEAKRALERGEIAVYDDRFCGNPSFQILRSCEVRKKRLKREVLQALIAYDRERPSDPPWQRTLPSLEREWLAHNFAYRVGFLRSRARDVDLDNHAEGKGSFGYFLESAWGVVRGYLKRGKSKK